jgi:uncharacterized protein YodC (DUF2158 family)
MEQRYFNQGDVVTLRQDIPNKPKMVVEKVSRSHLPPTGSEKTKLLGIQCIWFDSNFTLQKHVFNTKDLDFAE